MGLRSTGRTVVYSTPNPFIIHARVLLETSQGNLSGGRRVDDQFAACRIRTGNSWRIPSL